MYDTNNSQILGTSAVSAPALIALGVEPTSAILIGVAIFVVLFLFYIAYKYRNRSKAK